MTMFWLRPVTWSCAPTETMPFTSISWVTSIWGRPFAARPQKRARAADQGDGQRFLITRPPQITVPSRSRSSRMRQPHSHADGS
jgi:hypothetical protein